MFSKICLHILQLGGGGGEREETSRDGARGAVLTLSEEYVGICMQFSLRGEHF